VINYLTANFYWIKTQIAANKADPYWYQVNLIFIQFQGLYNGYYGYDVFDQNQNIFDQINQNPKSYLQMLWVLPNQNAFVNIFVLIFIINQKCAAIVCWHGGINGFFG